MTPPDIVLAAYPQEMARRAWMPVGGGFSGATVWKGMAPDGSAVALKLWPAGFPAKRVRLIHEWLEVLAPLPFAPRIIPVRRGNSVAESDGRVYDLSTWMPGEADPDPTDERLTLACKALAQFHSAWFSFRGIPERTPAVVRRLALFGSYRAWQGKGGRPAEMNHPNLNAACAEAFSLLPKVIPGLERDLEPWRLRPLPTFPCLCDVHTGHVLFTGNRVSGVIDFGAMKVDHPAVDLARYLGAATNGDGRQLRVGLEAYHSARPPVEVTEELVLLLDRSGAAGGLANWLLRFSAGHPVADPKTVAKRMARMLVRLRLPAGAGSH